MSGCPNGLQRGLQAAPKARAHCHINVALVNVASPNARDLTWLPSHDSGHLLIGQTSQASGWCENKKIQPIFVWLPHPWKGSLEAVSRLHLCEQ